MAEIRIKLGEIDYVSLIKVAFPLVKEKLQDEGGMVGALIKNVNEPDDDTIRTILKLVPEGVRDKLIEAALEKYKDEIPGMLMNLARSKGLNLEIRDVEIHMN